MVAATVLVVPGLRDHVPSHWQTLLAERHPRCRVVPPMGRTDLSCARRVEALERVAQDIEGPLLLVAHSGGVMTVVHWAFRTSRAVLGALLATPADMETPMPKSFPTVEEFRAGGWLPVPHQPLPFPAIVAASRNDPLAAFNRATQLAGDWGARLVDLGMVGHLNPGSGYGPWPRAAELIQELCEET